jgi:DNA-directed RNA polymerase subunit E'/Rpb7
MSTKSSSPFVQVKATFKVALAPDASSNPMLSIRKQLNDLLHKYSNEVSGVILSYDSLTFEKGKEYARIIGEFPWLHVTVNTKCLVFQPRIGLIVPATVSKVSIFLSIQFSV